MAVRALLESNGVGYAVAGDKFYTVTAAGVVTERGTLGTDEGPLTMESNGLQVAVADGTLYVYDIAAETFGAVVDAPSAATVTYMDGYGIFNQVDAGTFYITGLQDFSTVGALDFASAESSPDDLIRVFADHGELWLFGANSIEPWYNSGNADFPFSRIGQTRIERGLGAIYSVAKCDNSVFWMGNDLVVYRADGYQPVRISTEQVEFALGRMTDPSDAIAFTYDQEGHKFYCLIFPTDGQTWVYDVATQLWHERSSGGGAWLARAYMLLGNRHLIGAGEQLLELRTDLYSEDGTDLVAQHTAPVAWDDLKRLSHNRFELDIEAGVGEQGEREPVVILDWSDDGGRTWSNQLSRSMGAIGRYLTRLVWNRLGTSIVRNYRITISDPVKRVILGGSIDVSSGGR
jgi:hypothetical protein